MTAAFTKNPPFNYIYFMNDFSHIDDNFVDQCIKSGQLQLTKDERWSHFLPVIWLVIVAIVRTGNRK